MCLNIIILIKGQNMSFSVNLDKLKNIIGDKTKLDPITFQKMIFIYNAIDDGWNVKKMDDTFVLSKKHLGKKEIFREDYLSTFMDLYLDVNKYV